MRVLHILNELKPSGAETMLLSAARMVKDAGLDCDILATGEQVGCFAERLSAAGYGIHHIPFRKSLTFFWAVYQLISGNYEVVHLHTERANFWIGLVACMATRGVVLRTIHNNFEFRGSLRWRRGLQRRLLAYLGVKHVAIGESVQRNELERFGLVTQLVPNWYDSNRFTNSTLAERHLARLAMNIPPDANVIVSVGNCSNVKNHAVIFEALALLKPERRPIYLHVGLEEGGQPERQMARELGLSNWVRFLGPLEEIRPALHAADIFVMPSLYEGFGIAAVEAMATGLPAILADVPGLKDFRKKTEGAMYSKPDAVSLAQVISGIFSMPHNQRWHLGEKAAKDMASQYRLEVGAGSYLQIYRGQASKKSDEN